MVIDSVIHTNQESIDRVLGAGVPVLLVFSSAGAPLPPALAATLDELAKRHAGALLVAQIDGRAQPALLQRFEIRQTPAVAVVRAGAVLARLAGRMTDAELQPWVNHLLAGAPPPAPEAAPAVASATAATAAAGAQPLTLTDGTFAATVRGPLPVLVDFWAPWCGPCRMVAPAVEQLARDFAGRAVVAKLNVDENPMTPGQFGIRGIPTLLIFKGGQVVDQILGAQPYEALAQRLSRHL